jgi:hypothetical protein
MPVLDLRYATYFFACPHISICRPAAAASAPLTKVLLTVSAKGILAGGLLLFKPLNKANHLNK